MNLVKNQTVYHPTQGKGTVTSVDNFVHITFGKYKYVYLLTAPFLKELTLKPTTVTKKKWGSKPGYVLPPNVIDWAPYQTNATKGMYTPETPWSTLNAISERKVEHSLKHLMFVLAEHHGGVVNTIDVEQETTVKVGDSTSTEKVVTPVKFIIDSIEKIVMRLRTDEGNGSQNSFAEQVQTAIEAKYPEAEGWKQIDGHEAVLTKLTGFGDVKRVLTTEFLSQVGPFLKVGS